jgi:hypothetical protein
MARWNSCNVLRIAPDARRFWQFDARGGGFVLGREHSGAAGESLPPSLGAKTWRSLWQPKLNIAWLPPENVFLRVAQFPKSSFEETLAMVELQLEKLSPMPVTQIVWSLHVLPQAADLPRQGEATAGELQTVIVVIAERTAVEEFLGKLEGQGYLADRLEVPMLDQLAVTPAAEDSAWVYPEASADKSVAVVAWWCGGGLRNLSVVILPPTGDRAASLRGQIAQLAWAGELEGWLTAPPRWYLVADAATAAEWEPALREGLGEPVQMVEPLPAAELATLTACRAAKASPRSNLLPAEFSTRYHQQFVDRLWLRGLIGVGVVYAVGVIIYICAVNVLAYHTHGVERQASAFSGGYTNTLRLKARYEVLKGRQELKYAALDCWKIVAEQLPPGLSLQRLSFADGQKLALNGTAPPDQITKITDFSDAMRKATLNSQPMFTPEGSEQLNYRQSANNIVSWNFSLMLKHREEAQ